ncbi:MAG: T9SS type A sorting domain-containing protein [Bacteroidota bacterium]
MLLLPTDRLGAQLRARLWLPDTTITEPGPFVLPVYGDIPFAYSSYTLAFRYDEEVMVFDSVTRGPDVSGDLTGPLGLAYNEPFPGRIILTDNAGINNFAPLDSGGVFLQLHFTTPAKIGGFSPVVIDSIRFPNLNGPSMAEVDLVVDGGSVGFGSFAGRLFAPHVRLPLAEDSTDVRLQLSSERLDSLLGFSTTLLYDATQLRLVSTQVLPNGLGIRPAAVELDQPGRLRIRVDTTGQELMAAPGGAAPTPLELTFRYPGGRRVNTPLDFVGDLFTGLRPNRADSLVEQQGAAVDGFLSVGGPDTVRFRVARPEVVFPGEEFSVAVLATEATVFSRAEFSTSTNLSQVDVRFPPGVNAAVTDQGFGVFRYLVAGDRPGTNLRLAAGDTLFTVRMGGEPLPFRLRLNLFNGDFRRNLTGLTAPVPLAHVFTNLITDYGLDTVRLQVRQVADTILAGQPVPCLEVNNLTPSRASELLLSMRYDEAFLRPDTVNEGSLRNYSTLDSTARSTFADIFPGFALNQEYVYLSLREPRCNGIALPASPVLKICPQPLRDTFTTTVAILPRFSGSRDGFARLEGCASGQHGLQNLPLVVDSTVMVVFPFVRDTTTTTTAVRALEGLHLYPNPTSDIVYLRGWQPGDQIRVYANDGRRLVIQPGLGTLDLTHLPRGLYHVLVRRHARSARFTVVR